jgi:hypothetical protein
VARAGAVAGAVAVEGSTTMRMIRFAIARLG